MLSWPDWGEVRWFLCMGVVAVAAHQMIVLALARVDASVVAPMQYLEIFSATLLGWWIFGDFPDAMKWLGISIIIGSGLFIIARERKAARAG